MYWLIKVLEECVSVFGSVNVCVNGVEQHAV